MGLIGVVGQYKISLRLDQIAKGSNPTTAHRIQNPQTPFTLLVKISGEHGKVAACCALMSEECISDVEVESPFDFTVQFVAVNSSAEFQVGDWGFRVGNLGFREG